MVVKIFYSDMFFKIESMTYKEYLLWESIYEEIGVEYLAYNDDNDLFDADYFEVLDEKKFFLGVIKYGLKFEIIDEKELFKPKS